MNIMKTSPAVFAVGKNYQILVPVNCDAIMWVKVNDKCYYDHSNGILRSSVTLHRIEVPQSEMNSAGRYTICYRKMIERKPYGPISEDTEEVTIKFRAPVGKDLRFYHISDTHNMVEQPVAAYKTYEKAYGKIDFLIMNGDLPDHSGKIENFDFIYHMAERITHGEMPIVFSRGNHDMRGLYAEKFADYTPTDRGNSYFTFRLGSLWGMVLDCGEDKDDSNESYNYTICGHSFRAEQTEFINRVILNAKDEYLAPDVQRRIIVSHVPFSHIQKPPFDIEQDTYHEWCRLIRENIKPDLMLAGHMHFYSVSHVGSELDDQGQPCTVIIASTPDLRTGHYSGAGIKFTDNKARSILTNDQGQTVSDEEFEL